MKYLKYISMLLAIVATIALAIPTSWLFLAIAPILFLMSAPLIVIMLAFAQWKGREPINLGHKSVLFIDNDPVVSAGLMRALKQYWNVDYAATTLRGIVLLFRKQQYDLIVVRWQRKKLAGEKFLDFLDESIAKKAIIGSIDENFKMPAIVFLRKEDTPPFSINHEHMSKVLGCIDLNKTHLVNSIFAIAN